MDKRTISGLLIAAVLGLFPAAAFFHFRSKTPELTGFRKQFQTMGTIASFTFYTADRESFVKACEIAKREFDRVMQIANLYDPKSELSELNSHAGNAPFSCTPEMWTLLMRAEQAWKESSGKFDITVKPLMNLWGFYRKRKQIPDAAELKAVMNRIGFDKLQFDREKHTVKFAVPGMALDLGGIAKGYALDCAANAVAAAGIGCGVLDLGGNLKMLPQVPPGKQFYTVGVRNPAKTESLLPLVLKLPGDSAVSTSGDYERFVTYGRRRYGHIIDPHSGTPEARIAVTVTTKSALDADIFSTSAYLGGRECAEKLEQLYPGSKFYFTPPEE